MSTSGQIQFDSSGNLVFSEVSNNNNTTLFTDDQSIITDFSQSVNEYAHAYRNSASSNGANGGKYRQVIDVKSGVIITDELPMKFSINKWDLEEEELLFKGIALFGHNIDLIYRKFFEKGRLMTILGERQVKLSPRSFKNVKSKLKTLQKKQRSRYLSAIDEFSTSTKRKKSSSVYQNALKDLRENIEPNGSKLNSEHNTVNKEELLSELLV